jgi:hypothetical protein
MLRSANRKVVERTATPFLGAKIIVVAQNLLRICQFPASVNYKTNSIFAKSKTNRPGLVGYAWNEHSKSNSGIKIGQSP